MLSCVSLPQLGILRGPKLTWNWLLKKHEKTKKERKKKNKSSGVAQATNLICGKKPSRYTYVQENAMRI